MIGFGWCHLRSSRTALATATVDDATRVESAIDVADEQLWVAFRDWMASNCDPFTQWQFSEQLNNEKGLLTFALSRNHRTSSVWKMLEWIATNGPGSYGLFYCHDDEDTMDREIQGRMPPMDYDNVFRVQRILNGQIIELDDPFFGPIEGNIDPVHPHYRSSFD